MDRSATVGAWSNRYGGLGETEAARVDFATYLRRFPEGRFIAEARRLLPP
jgi:hypothetical protein